MKVIAKTDYYSIEVDKNKNRVYLTIVGFWPNPSVVPDYLDDIKKTAQELYPGFTILTDVTRMKIPPRELAALHEEAQRVIVNAGLKKTAEIVPTDHAIERMALKHWSDKSGMTKRMFHDKSLAEDWLDEE